MARRNENGLTELMQEFCDTLLTIEEWNPTAAYRKIRPKSTQKTQENQASRLMGLPEVQAYLEQAKFARQERVKWDADRLLKRFEEKLEADLADLYGDDGKLLPPRQWPAIWRKSLVVGIKHNNDGSMVIKLSDRTKTEELLGKHTEVKAFSDLPAAPGEIHLTINRPARPAEEAKS